VIELERHAGVGCVAGDAVYVHDRGAPGQALAVFDLDRPVRGARRAGRGGREEIAVAAAALRLRRPVKWIEDRKDALAAAFLAREQRYDARAAFDRSPDGLGGVRLAMDQAERQGGAAVDGPARLGFQCRRHGRLGGAVPGHRKAPVVLGEQFG
jgi:hypothetical protein